MKERRYTKQQYFSPGMQVAVYHCITPRKCFEPGCNVRNKRDFWKITYIRHGEGLLITNERPYPFHSGFIFLTRPDDLTTFELQEDVELCNILFFHNTLLPWLNEFGEEDEFFKIFQDSSEQNEIRAQMYQMNANQKIETLVAEMQREFLREDTCSPHLLKVYLQQLLLQMKRLGERQFTQKRRYNLISYVLSNLEKNYSENFDYHKAASKLGITHIYLCSVYRREMGESIGQTQFRIRLKNAKRLLTESSKSVIEIAAICGFNDLSYFYRSFKKDTGKTPIDFRKHHSFLA